MSDLGDDQPPLSVQNSPGLTSADSAIRTSVVMLTKNNGQTLDEVLGAIFNQETAQPFEVIHVDSGSTDDTLTVADRYACRRYQIPSADFSHSATRNFAASLSRGELVVYVSADAAPAASKASSTHVGAWSLAPSSPRTQRSTPAAFRRGATSAFSNR